jgi:hypothetical protein
MALISEVADKIYEITPEGKGHEVFPLCTVYLVVDDKTALVGILAKESVMTAEDILAFPYFTTLAVEGYRQSFKRKNLI